jgi:hypothetical protein
MTSYIPQPRVGSQRRQFSLGGLMFICVTGLCFGMAYWRWRGGRVSEAMLATFTTWLLLGLSSNIARRFRQLKDWSKLDSNERLGLAFQLALPIWACLLLAVIDRFHFIWRFDPPRPDGDSQIANILFFLAIIAAYWEPRQNLCHRSRVWRWIDLGAGAVLVAVGVFWAAKIVLVYAGIFGFVLTVVRRVEASQPTTWNDRPFAPERLPFDSSTLERLSSDLWLALIMLAAVVAFGVLVVWLIRTRRQSRNMCLIAWLLSLIAVLSWAVFSVSNSRDERSLIEMASLTAARWETLILLGILVFAAVTGISLNVSAARVPARLSSNDSPTALGVVPLHQRAGVIAFGILAIAVSVGYYDFWETAFGDSGTPLRAWLSNPQLTVQRAITVIRDFALEWPESAIQVAAACCLIDRLFWGWWRPPDPQPCWIVEANTFLSVFLVSLAAFIVVLPTAIWWQFVTAIR